MSRYPPSMAPHQHGHLHQHPNLHQLHPPRSHTDNTSADTFAYPRPTSHPDRSHAQLTNTAPPRQARTPSRQHGQPGQPGQPSRPAAGPVHPHVCDICHRTFTRREHLKRHQSCHDPSSNFICRLCSATFSRSDALKRHESLHANPNATATTGPSSTSPSAASRTQSHHDPASAAYNTTSARSRAAITKTRKACTSCSRSKIKCDGQPVCRNCQARPGTVCHYPQKRSYAPQPAIPRTSPDQPSASTTTASSQPDSPSAPRPALDHPSTRAAAQDDASTKLTHPTSDATPCHPLGPESDLVRSDLASSSSLSSSSSLHAAPPKRSTYTVDSLLAAGSHTPPRPYSENPASLEADSKHPQPGSTAMAPSQARGYAVPTNPSPAQPSAAYPSAPRLHGSSPLGAAPRTVLEQRHPGPRQQYQPGGTAAPPHRHDSYPASSTPASSLYPASASSSSRVSSSSGPSTWSDPSLPTQDWLDFAFSDSSMIAADQTFDWLFAPIETTLGPIAQPAFPQPLATAGAAWPMPTLADAAGAANPPDLETLRQASGPSASSATAHQQPTSLPSAPAMQAERPSTAALPSGHGANVDGGERRSRKRPRREPSYSLSRSGIQSSTHREGEHSSEDGDTVDHAMAGKAPRRPDRGRCMPRPIHRDLAGPCAMPDGFWRHPAASPLTSSTEPIGEATRQDLLAEDTMQVAPFTAYSKKKLLSVVALAELPKHDEERALAMLQGVSVATYNALLQLYFVHFHVQYPFLHAPTFSPDKCPVFLLANAIALGSLSSRIPRAANLGHVLAEITNKAQFVAWHRTNLQERSLGFIQAMVLSDIFMRSTGDRRLLEFAEAIRSPLATLARRRRLLDKTSTHSAPDPAQQDASTTTAAAYHGGGTRSKPTQSASLAGWSQQAARPAAAGALCGADDDNNGGDPAASLHARWQAWIHLESLKRTGWAVFVADAELSVSWNLPSLFSFDELKSELPCPDASWNAPNATMWSLASRHDTRAAGYYTVADFHTALEEGTATRLLNDEIKASDFQRTVLANSLWSLSDAVSTVGKGCLALHAREVTETFRSLCIGLAEQQAEVLERYLGSSVALLGEPRQAPTGGTPANPKLELAVRFDLLRTLVDLQDLQVLGGRHSQREKAETLGPIKERFDRRPWEAWSLAVHAGRIVYFFRTFPTSSTFEGLLFFYAAISVYLVSLWWKDKGDLTIGQLANPFSVGRKGGRGGAGSHPPTSPGGSRSRLSSSIAEVHDDAIGREVLSVHLDGPAYAPISLSLQPYDAAPSGPGPGLGVHAPATDARHGADAGSTGTGTGSLDALAATAESSSRAAAKVVRPRLSFIGDLSSPLAPKRILSSYSDQLAQRAASTSWPICEPLSVILAQMVEISP